MTYYWTLNCRLMCATRGAPKGRARGARAPLGTWKTLYFQGFSVKLRYLHLWSQFFLYFLLCGRTEEACSMVNSLRKVDFSYPTGHYTWKKSPLEKILGAPLWATFHDNSADFSQFLDQKKNQKKTKKKNFKKSEKKHHDDGKIGIEDKFRKNSACLTRHTKYQQYTNEDVEQLANLGTTWPWPFKLYTYCLANLLFTSRDIDNFLKKCIVFQGP